MFTVFPVTCLAQTHFQICQRLQLIFEKPHLVLRIYHPKQCKSIWDAEQVAQVTRQLLEATKALWPHGQNSFPKVDQLPPPLQNYGTTSTRGRLRGSRSLASPADLSKFFWGASDYL